VLLARADSGPAVFDFVQSVVGEVLPDTTEARVQLQRPDVRIRDAQSGQIVETVRSDVPDLLHLHGMFLLLFQHQRWRLRFFAQVNSRVRLKTAMMPR
jgi:hypothetical protein